MSKNPSVPRRDYAVAFFPYADDPSKALAQAAARDLTNKLAFAHKTRYLFRVEQDAMGASGFLVQPVLSLHLMNREELGAASLSDGSEVLAALDEGSPPAA